MHQKELNDRSPLRVFEKSIHGGLGAGNIGVVVARHGVGKTAFVVGVALDDLMRGRKVFHVSIGQAMGKVRDHYDEIFDDLARTMSLEDAASVKREMERCRNIHAYLGNTFSVEKLREDLALLREHVHFEPSCVVVDGWDFEQATAADLAELHAIAKRFEAELWMTAVTHRWSPRSDRGIPEPVAHVEDSVDVIVSLAHDGRAVQVRLLKDHENPEPPEAHVILDPTTMLLVEEEVSP